MTDERRDLLIDKYHRGVITPAELTELNQWLSPDDNVMLEVSAPEAQIRASILTAVQRKIAAEKKRHTGFSKSYQRLAATVLLFVLAGYSTYRFREDIRNRVDPVVFKEQVATIGSVVKLVLNDGTTVWLNAGSRLRYPDKFNRDTREVTLHGEAFFEVTHAPDRPFVVHAGPLDVRVLGTSFNVQSYDDEPELAVTLVTGIVQLRGAPDLDTSTTLVATLAPGEQARFDKAKAALITKPVEAPLYAQWRTGELKFTDAPLQDILHALERRYGVHFVVEGVDADACRFTTGFKRMSLHDALAIVGMIANTTYTIRGNEITMKGNGCGLKQK